MNEIFSQNQARDPFGNLCSRRHWLQSSAFGLGSIAAAMLLKQDGLFAQQGNAPKKPALETPVYDLLPSNRPSPLGRKR